MDVCGSILANLDAGYPCRHDKGRIFTHCEGAKVIEYFVLLESFVECISVCRLS